MSTGATGFGSQPAAESTTRVAHVCVLLAAALPGMLFAPVFGVPALALPIGVLVLVGCLVGELAIRFPAVVPWRPLLVLLLGLIGLVETALWPTTSAGVPTAATLRALTTGLAESWQRTLQSTWPALPDPELVLFVPLAVLVAMVLGVELLNRVRWPLVAMLPGLVVLGLSQAYVALSGFGALLAGLVFATLVAVLLAVTRPRARGAGGDRLGRRTVITLVLVAPTLLLAVAGGVAFGALDVTGRDPYSLRRHAPPPTPPARVSSPLDEVPALMSDPDVEVFRYTSDVPVERWRMTALDQFDGATWKPTNDYRRLGTELRPPPSVTVGLERQSAHVTMERLTDPWLPSQAMPAEVRGVKPLVDESAGSLLLPNRTGPTSYDLSWWEPKPEALVGLGIDPKASYGGLGTIPPGIDAVATAASGGMRPSVQTALAIERYLSKNYQVANDNLPTGSGWQQLSRFLLEDKIGTSEQFAAAYVVLARMIGIPARVAVGFRSPEPEADGTVVVHNSDVWAWPEVAVAGVGWVGLDPSGAAVGSSGGDTGGLAEATAQAREDLPPPEDLKDPELPADQEASAFSAGGGSFPWLVLAIVVGGLLLLWVVGIPLAKAVRGWLRRRKPGPRGVVNAWAEARDRLRSAGLPFTVGMTVRDLAATVGPMVDGSVVTGLQELAVTVDRALWSGATHLRATNGQAWSAVRTVRRGLAKRPFGARLRAALNPWSLLPPRA